MSSSDNQDPFVPREVRDYTGGKLAGLIKNRPEDFVVEEFDRHHRRTVSTSSDLTAGGEPCNKLSEAQDQDTRFVSVTLVKSGLTVWDIPPDLAHRLRIPPHRITFSGIKDRKAITAQAAVIEGASLEAVRALAGTGDEPIRYRHGNGWWFIKDVQPAYEPLKKGALEGNHFRIRVVVPGMKAGEITSYVEDKMEILRRRAREFCPVMCRNFKGQTDVFVPNFYGGQRVGKRFNTDNVGEALWRNGAMPAIRHFLCQTSTSDNEARDARHLREQMAEIWGYLDYERKCTSEEDVDAQRYFKEMLQLLEQRHEHKSMPLWESLSLTLEYDIVKALANGHSPAAIMGEMEDKFSFWVGAFQGYWFNQVLAAIIRKEVQIRGNGSLPLITCGTEAMLWYLRHCPQAVPVKKGMESVRAQLRTKLLGVDHLCLPYEERTGRYAGVYSELEQVLDADPVVRTMFLNPRQETDRNGRIREMGPWRQAFIPVLGLKHHAADSEWHVEFDLGSGCYASILLECLFATNQGQQGRCNSHRTGRSTRRRRFP